MRNTDVPSLSAENERTSNTRSYRTASIPLLPLLLTMAAGLLPVAGCNHGHNADVVATVNGHAIMQADLEKAYKLQLGDAAQQQQQPSPEQADSLRLNLLRELIDEEIVEQRAAKMNLTATNEEVDAKLAEMKAPYTEEQFQQRLKASNQTIDDVKHSLRRSLTINKLLNKEINSKITVTDADVASYYNQHKAEFNLLETKYRLATIQVTGQPSPQPGNLQGSKATNDVEAKKKIQALKNRLDSGEDFGTIASNWSEQPQTAPNGGEMGFVDESQLHQDPTAFNAITKLKAGQITDILPLLDAQTKRPAGYAIYKLISRDPAGQRDVNDPRVQQAIRQQLRDVRSQLLKSAYLEMVHDQAKVENFFAEQIFKTDAH
ncbi:SurA N-terminal domain-containing protein [Tunturiibacter empetritectus]|uniref:Peptidyl-prolyl cis-trans isomerase SurA n=2 Tax=Tunturiibacter TaxID=3154218 RepID=A0A852VH06_9BACT|nr:SurA N-terminal domain-containing protein [Edaphobacter lichenicola]NYF92093.1 peptidyl-prolyl cis-trans isomerase SurA [Edaphobacter lichenicola]